MEIDGNSWIPEHAVKILQTGLGLPNGVFVCGDSAEIAVRHGLFLAESIAVMIDENDGKTIIGNTDDKIVNVFKKKETNGVLLVTRGLGSLSIAAVKLSVTSGDLFRTFWERGIIPVIVNPTTLSDEFAPFMFDHCFVRTSNEDFTEDGKPIFEMTVRTRHVTTSYFIHPFELKFRNGLFQPAEGFGEIDRKTDDLIRGHKYDGNLTERSEWERLMTARETKPEPDAGQGMVG
jgi:hypothetical protein